MNGIETGPALPRGLSHSARTYLRAIREGSRGPASFVELIVRDRPDHACATIASLEEIVAWGAALDEPHRTRIATQAAALNERPAALADLTDGRPAIMGVINVTPDSFSDGGRLAGSAEAVAFGETLARAGAAILDVGGESTRPGAAPTPQGTELTRVLPVVERLAAAGHVVSIDTRKAAVMRAAVAAGARIINDVSALSHDNESLAVATEAAVPVILMHARGEPTTMQKEPRYDLAILDVFDALESRIAACLDAGIPRGRLIVDPGIGFGKTLTHNLEILRRLSLFQSLGAALCVGVSRKSFIGRLTGVELAEKRLAGSLSAALWAVGQGVDIIRVHDVAETHQALAVWQAIAN